MNEQRAMITIGASEQDDLESMMERWEDTLFELNTYFMRRAFIPKLASTRRKKLQELSEAGAALQLGLLQSGSEADEQGRLIELTDSPYHTSVGFDIASLVERYNSFEAGIKQKLANSADPDSSIRLYKAWEESCEAFAQQFCDAYEHKFGRLNPDPEAKLSDFMIFNELDNTWEATSVGPGTLKHRYYSRLLKIRT